MNGILVLFLMIAIPAIIVLLTILLIDIIEKQLEQDINGEYEPPLEWEQKDVKLLLQYIKNQTRKIEKLKKVSNNVKD